MKRTKKMMKVAQRVLGALVVTSLCIGVSGLDALASENDETEEKVEIC